MSHLLVKQIELLFNRGDNNEITTNLKNYKIKNKNDNANINK